MSYKYDPDFIKEEVRDDWKVSTETKKVWSVQLDLIKKLDEVCRKYDLKWYPMWGTLLGVVRHHGYIPWDDDVDIVMMRDDYEKLLAVANSEFEYPYFMQTTLRDEECFYMWAILRNSDTTGNRETCLSKKQNNGIGIDIMPLDGCENTLTEYRIARFLARVISVLANTYMNDFNKTPMAEIMRKLLRTTGFNHKRAYLWSVKNNKRYRVSSYAKVAFRAHADSLYQKRNLRKDMWDKSDFDDVIYMKFENINIPVPAGYDHLLKQIYGDYMKFPPMEKRKGKHDVIYAPDIPYKEYCSGHYDVRYD